MPHYTLLSSTYLGPVSYYAKLYHAKHVFIEQYENYTKQTFRNRCLIATANGIQPLTIPTESNGGNKCLIKDIRISDHGNWRHLHWTAFESAYRQSPYFEYYADDFRPFYEKRFNYLFDFNEQLRELVCSLIGFTPHIRVTENYQNPNTLTYVEDLRELIHPKRNFRLLNQYQVVTYYQVFKSKHGFLPNLSIADLLFNMGPESLLILRDSVNESP